MSEIRPLVVEDLERAVDIFNNAYPAYGADSPEARERMIKGLTRRIREDKQMVFHGLFRDGEMQAVMRLHDYQMNLFGKKTLVGGGGALAVDLCHKHEHAALDFMRFFFDHYREKQSPLAILWPFRPDFYARMGAGEGPRTDFFKIHTKSLPHGCGKEKIRFLKKEDLPALVAFYNRYAAKTHGMIEDELMNREISFERQKSDRYIGYFENGEMQGYAIFRFVKDNPNNPLDNHIQVNEWLYDSPAALAGLTAFFRSQEDQIGHILLPTPDRDFHLMLDDPRNDSNNVHPQVYQECCISTVGIMYRVLDTAGMFQVLAHRNFGGETLRVRFNVADNFIETNNRPVTIQFNNGTPEVVENVAEAEVELSINMPEFSSLIIGAVRLKKLVMYSRATVSDPARLDQLDRLLAAETRPICLTQF
ncbi:MAG TPA: GNAT family N-acetyltransferase [candidate division Zixibacteria bacterium]|nr:GNAT family N-acetyltransferase [candidate division Zixibacteria bacterium]